MKWREWWSRWENKLSKIGDKESGMVLIVLMNNRLLSSLWLLFFIRLIKELRSIEIFLPWTDKTFNFWLIILSWEIYVNKFSLLQVWLTNLTFCISSSIPFPFTFLMLFRYGMSIKILLMCYSFIGAIYIYFLELSNFFINITDL